MPHLIAILALISLGAAIHCASVISKQNVLNSEQVAISHNKENVRLVENCGRTIFLGSGAKDTSFLLLKANNESMSETGAANDTTSCSLIIETRGSPIGLVVYHYSVVASSSSAGLDATSLLVLDLDGFPDGKDFRGTEDYSRCLPDAAGARTARNCQTPHFATLDSGNRLRISLREDNSSALAGDAIALSFLFTAFAPASCTPGLARFDCPLNTFNCLNGRCIRKSLQGDGFNDCGNYRDEHALNESRWTSASIGLTITYILCFNLLLGLIVWATCIRNARLGSRPSGADKVPQINEAFQSHE